MATTETTAPTPPASASISPYSKPCTLCATPRDVLIRCRIDDTGSWHFICPGRCWRDVSGGEIDGDAAHPHYTYGGMWKNKHEAVSAKKRKKGKPPRVEVWSDGGDVGGRDGDATATGEEQLEQEHPEEQEEHASTASDEEDEVEEQIELPVKRRSNLKFTKNDRVTHNGKLYQCRKSHWQEDSKPPSEDVHLWSEIGEAT